MSNLKKHDDRPALRAVDVWRWISNGILTIRIIKGSPIFFLAEGKSVRQSWYKVTGQTAEKKSAVTYLRKGLFLVPSWRKVTDREINYLKALGSSLCMQSILYFPGHGYHRLIYMQVEDLDHALRQQGYIIDNYRDKTKTLMCMFALELLREIEKEDRIIKQIGERKIAADSLHTRTCLRIDSIGRSISSIATNAPIFRTDFADEGKQTVITVLERAVREIRSFTFRPVNRPIGFARRSLELAIKHLRNNRPSLARDRLRSAVKNLKYPKDPNGSESSTTTK